jgi:hypothetical protein
MVGANIEFDFATVADEERFIRDYLVDAWNRFETSDFFDVGWFWRYGPYNQYKEGSTGGHIRIVFEGAVEPLIESEKTYWDEFEGLENWRAKKGADESDTLLAQQKIASGEQVGEWDYRIKPLVTRFVLDYYREFPEPLHMSAEDDSDIHYGYWVTLHYLTVLAGYDRYDETTGALEMLRSRVRSIGKYQSAEAAREEYRRLLEAWEAFGENLDIWLDEHQTGQSERVNLSGEE